MANDALNKVFWHLRRAVMLQDGGGQADGKLLGCFIEDRDETAFEVLMRRHGPSIMGMCRRILLNQQDAEDAFQATFLVLLRKATSVVPREMVGSWLYGVARQTATRMRAQKTRRRWWEKQVATMPEPQSVNSPSNDDLLILDQELSRLPDKYRIAIILCDLQGKTRKQAARQLGWAEGTVSSRLARGRTMLAKRLAKHGVLLSVEALAVVLSQNMASASLPPTLVSATVKAASMMVAGQTVAVGLISAKVAALTEGAVKGMLLTKLKTMMAVVVMVGVGTFGGGVLVHRSVGTLAADAEKKGTTQTEGHKARETLAGALGASGTEPRTDTYGDPLPEGAVNRLGTIRFNHGARLNSLLFTPDGKTIVSEGSGKIRLWDAASGKELREISTGESTWDDQVVLSADGKRLMILQQESADTIRVWRLADGKEVEKFPLPVRRTGHDVWHRNALSPDGRFCAVSLPKQIRVFEIATAKELWTLPNTESDKATIVTFAGNDKVVTADHNSVVQLREAATGKLVREFNLGTKVGVLAAAIDGTRLATLEHHNRAIDRYLDKDLVHVWDLTTGKQLQTLAAPPLSWYMNIQFAPDGKTLFTSCYTEKIGTNADVS